MTEPTDIKVIRGSKREPCVYCGGEQHPVPLRCPRIVKLYISGEGYVEAIEFDPQWSEPPPGAA